MTWNFADAEVREKTVGTNGRVVRSLWVTLTNGLDSVTVRGWRLSVCAGKVGVSGSIGRDYDSQGEPTDNFWIAIDGRDELARLAEVVWPGQVESLGDEVPEVKLIDGSGPIRFEVEGEVYEITYKVGHDLIGEVVATVSEFRGKRSLQILHLGYADGKGQTDVSPYPATVSKCEDGVWRVSEHKQWVGL